MIRYAISIAVHNGLEVTKKCLESIFENSPADDTVIYVTDNASTDGVRDYLKSIEGSRPGFPEVVVRWNFSNKGFIRAHNEAVEQIASHEPTYFVVLNNDIVVGPEWLDALRKPFIEDPKVALTAPEGTCCELDNNGHGVGKATLEYLEGSCLMIPWSMTRFEPLFDEGLYRFGYCEDADLSLRLRKKGWKIARVPAKVTHYGAVTARAVRDKVDLDGFHKRNHLVFRGRWGRYLDRRNFARRIQLHRTGAVGDVLLMTPVIRALCEENAETEVYVVTESAPEVFDRNPYVKRAMRVPHPDLACDEHFNLDLVYERQPHRHIVSAYAEYVGVNVIDRRPSIYPSDEDRFFAHGLYGGKPGKVAVIHPGPIPGWPGRNWGPENHAEVARNLKQRGYSVILVGSSSAHLTPHDVDLRGKTTLHKLAAVIERCNLFVGEDSFPMHVATAFTRPIVGVFGMIDPEYRLPGVPFMVGASAPLEACGCLGCHHDMPAPRTEGSCFRGDNVVCMKALKVEQVMKCVDIVEEQFMATLETSKIRATALPYCVGRGIDIGCKEDKIKPDAVGFDKDMYPGHVDVRGDATHIDKYFKAEEFDYVYSSHCLEDIVDTEAALTKWLRILKPGGNIVLYLPHRDHYHGINLDHKHNFVNADITGILQKLGCTIVVDSLDVGDNRYSMFLVARKG